ncbi:hypothetical protein [Crateriforma conspicua]|uniref:Uncharacterized protein n=1 Tax=Crateriforma conspicua TaxID=2527996 RepID=A0A5C6FXU0_9PLAN|nr:hypothetical protein [Crateriforma conspicua]TWU66455.1 hypothetical protein V7x_20210 [Crateriforma conspicua]
MTQTLSAAVGPISKIAERLEATLIATHAWSELPDASVYHNDIPGPANRRTYTRLELERLRPLALIWTPDSNGIEWTRQTARGGHCVDSKGRLLVMVERNVPANEDEAEADRTWENWIGRLVIGPTNEPGLMNLAGDPRYLPITRVGLVDRFRFDRAKVKDLGDAQRAILLVEWSSQ